MSGLSGRKMWIASCGIHYTSHSYFSQQSPEMPIDRHVPAIAYDRSDGS